RNTCRYMLGNPADFDPARHAVAAAAMVEFDRYIMTRLEVLKTVVRRAFDNYDFQAAYQAILNFMVVDLSSLYIDVARDRLYCSGADSRERRSAQTALYLMLDTLVRMIAPLIPYTADEVYTHIPGKSASSVHLLTLRETDNGFIDTTLAARWEQMLAIRTEALKLLETMRQAGTIGAPLEARLSIGVTNGDSALDQILTSYREGLRDLFIVSQLDILDAPLSNQLKAQANGQSDFRSDGYFGRVSGAPAMVVLGRHAAGRKCQRCWMYYDDGGDPELCPRCRAVLRA
ncbi:MAG: class I tRNA ligase family protein, partial [Candidatus Binataceae bacterium]